MLLQLSQELVDIGLEVVSLGRIACGVHAWRAPESVHFEPRVVGEAVKPRAGVYVVRLDDRVLDKRLSRLFDILGDAHVGRAQQREALAEYLRGFAELSLVSGGKNDFHNRQR